VRATGRRLIYCCAACRQRDYRRRVAARPPVPMRLLMADLLVIRDREARKRGAIAVLEGLGYEVHLERIARPSPVNRTKRAVLKVVHKVEPDDEGSRNPD